MSCFLLIKTSFRKVSEVDTWLDHWLREAGVRYHFCELDLTFDLSVVTMTFKILSGLYIGDRNVMV